MTETIKPKGMVEIKPALQGLDVVRNHLLPSPEVGVKHGMWLTDLDDTVKEAKKHIWPDGKARKVLPETVAAFRALHAVGVPIGVVTEQSFAEMQSWMQDVARLVLDKPDANPYEVFNGLIIGEGGSVIKKPGQDEPIIVAPQRSLEDREKLLAWLSASETIVPSGEGNWGILTGVNPDEGTYIELPIGDDQGIATISLWEKGPHVSQDHSVSQKYHRIKARIDAVLEELSITTLRTFEAGNGTFRIVPANVNKGHTMELLKAVGLFDSEHAVYSCDGPNDVGFAQYLKKRGGAVIAVGNAVEEIKTLSDVIVQEHAGLGFAQTVEQLFQDVYTEALEAVQKEAFIRKFADDLSQVSPDLRSNDLAHSQAVALINKLWKQGSHSQEQLVIAGQQEWYHVGKEVLGPLMVSFVDQTLRNIPANGIAVFPARDASPFYQIAKMLQALNPSEYPVTLLNPVFNRKLWGVEDEQDPENGVSSISDPIVQKFLSQMGIGSGKPLSFIEVGAYGTMVRALKEAGYHDFGVQFFFSQVPFIPGFINLTGKGLQLQLGAEETIADSLEGLPKAYKRPTKLVQQQDGTVDVSWEGKKVDSPFLEPWQQALFVGLQEAAINYLAYKQDKREEFNLQTFAQHEMIKLMQLSQIAATMGEFTGVLPQHTESWSEKQDWINQWHNDFGDSPVPVVGR